MSMRTYSGLVLFQDIFNYIPTDSSIVTNLANNVMNPNVLIVEQDCGTQLGTYSTVNFGAEGLVETATGEVISLSRITQLLSQGQYNVYTRDVSSCTSTGGVCATCYNASFQDMPQVTSLTRVNIPSYVLVETSTNAQVNTGSVISLLDPTVTPYTRMLAYIEGVFLVPGVDYTLDGLGNLTLINTNYATGNYTLTLRYLNLDNSVFLTWFSNTYAASILGISSLSTGSLPIASLNIASILSENDIQLVSNFLQEMSTIPTEYSSYADKILDPLEKSLYLIILYSIYDNVISN